MFNLLLKSVLRCDFSYNYLDNYLVSRAPEAGGSSFAIAAAPALRNRAPGFLRNNSRSLGRPASVIAVGCTETKGLGSGLVRH